MDLSKYLRALAESSDNISFGSQEKQSNALQKDAQDIITKEISHGVPEQVARNSISQQANASINLLAKASDYTDKNMTATLAHNSDVPSEWGNKDLKGITYTLPTNKSNHSIVAFANSLADPSADSTMAHELAHVMDYKKGVNSTPSTEKIDDRHFYNSNNVLSLSNRRESPAKQYLGAPSEMLAQRFSELYQNGALDRDTLENTFKRAQERMNNRLDLREQRKGWDYQREKQVVPTEQEPDLQDQLKEYFSFYGGK